MGGGGGGDGVGDEVLCLFFLVSMGVKMRSRKGTGVGWEEERDFFVWWWWLWVRRLTRDVGEGRVVGSIVWAVRFCWVYTINALVLLTQHRAKKSGTSTEDKRKAREQSTKERQQ